jgi:hypothetical protein
VAAFSSVALGSSPIAGASSAACPSPAWVDFVSMEATVRPYPAGASGSESWAGPPAGPARRAGRALRARVCGHAQAGLALAAPGLSLSEAASGPGRRRGGCGATASPQHRERHAAGALPVRVHCQWAPRQPRSPPCPLPHVHTHHAGSMRARPPRRPRLVPEDPPGLPQTGPQRRWALTEWQHLTRRCPAAQWPHTGPATVDPPAPARAPAPGSCWPPSGRGRSCWRSASDGLELAPRRCQRPAGPMHSPRSRSLSGH